MMIKTLFTALCLTLLVGCQDLKDFVAPATVVTKAATLAVSAEDLAVELDQYIDGDEKATAVLYADDGPVEMAIELSGFLQGKLDVPIIDLVKVSPDFLDEFKPKMAEGKAAVIEYSERTDKPIPENIVNMWRDGAEVIGIVDKAIASNDRLKKAKLIYDSVKPLAKLAILAL